MGTTTTNYSLVKPATTDLADVAVLNGNFDTIDAQLFAKVRLTEAINTVADSGATQALAEPSAATVNDITLTAACALTFPTATPGTSFTLLLRQGGAGGYTVTWPTVKWSGGSAPVLSTAVDAVDIFSFVCVTAWNGFVAGLAMA